MTDSITLKTNNLPADSDVLAKLVGYNLKKLREKAGLTQEQLGEKIGLTVTAIKKNEQGITFPKIPTLNFLADYYGVSTDEILGRKSALKMELQREILLEQAIKRLSKYGQVDKTEKGGYLLTISKLTSVDGKVEEIRRAVTFSTGELLIKFVDSVTDAASSTSSTFAEILNL